MQTTEKANQLLTTGAICKRLGCPVFKVEYLIRSRSIPHVQRIGNLRVFTEKTLEIIEQEICRGDLRIRSNRTKKAEQAKRVRRKIIAHRCLGSVDRWGEVPEVSEDE